MDPTINLVQQRTLADRLLREVSQHDGRPANADEVAHLCELVMALDHWLSTGGALPLQWQR